MKRSRRLLAALTAALAFAATASAASRTPAEQIQVLADTADKGQEGGWFVTPEADADWNRWFYAVTDLDRDGQLEIFKAKRGGEYIVPELRCEELNDQGEGRSWGLFFAGGTDVPDILTGESAGNPLVLRDPAEKEYHYIFVSSRESKDPDWDFIDTKYALTLHGDLLVEELASMKVELGAPSSDLARRRFFLPDWHGVEAESGQRGRAEEISAERYAEIWKERFPGLEEIPGALRWISGEELRPSIGQPGLRRLLEGSFAFFDGNG